MRKIIAWMFVFCMIFSCAFVNGIKVAEAEEEQGMEHEEWYDGMLANAMLNAGNNKRLKKVIERAMNGEEITIATIGGSITEGAGAATYAQCWARKLLDGFRERYAADDPSKIGLVNAGVGGTASTFGWIRWERDIISKVQDPDGLPDLVVIEYAVNDGGEPTGHRCYESMVRSILAQPNEPAVILLFSVFPGGYTLQNELKPIGNAYDLMMVSMKNSAYPHVGKEWTQAEFYFDQYHPTTMGHGVMADCILKTIETAAAMPEAEADIDLDEIKPVFGDQFVGLKRIFRDSVDESLNLKANSFGDDDVSSYRNQPVGRVCGPNFFHNGMLKGKEPLTFTTTFRQLLVACRTTPDEKYGKFEVVVDGEVTATVNPHTNGSWGQSDVFWVYHNGESKEHTVEIRMVEGEETKKCTITAIAYVP